MGLCSKERNLYQNVLKLRLRFAQEVRCKLSPNFWEEDVGFYLDGASFTQNRNTFNENRAPEDISRSTLEKDLILVSLEKAVMKAQDVALYMVVIAYGRNVIAAEQYHGRINPKTFSSFVCEHLASVFKKVLTQGGILF